MMSAHANRMIPPAWMSEERSHGGHVGWIGGDVYRGAKKLVATVAIKTGIYNPGGGEAPDPDPLEDNPNVIMHRDRASAAQTDAEIEAACVGEDPALCAYPLKQHREAAIAKIARLNAAEALKNINVITDSDRNEAALTDTQIEAICTPLLFIPGAVEGCRLTAQGQRSDAQAKIARLTPPPDAGAGGKWAGFTRAPNLPIIADLRLAPRPKAPPKKTEAPPKTLTSPAATAAYVGAAPVVIGGLAAIKFGWVALAAGGAIGVVAAGGVYAWMKLSQQP